MIPRPRTEAMGTSQPDDDLVLLLHTTIPLRAAIEITRMTLTAMAPTAAGGVTTIVNVTGTDPVMTLAQAL